MHRVGVRTKRVCIHVCAVSMVLLVRAFNTAVYGQDQSVLQPETVAEVEGRRIAVRDLAPASSADAEAFAGEWLLANHDRLAGPGVLFRLTHSGAIAGGRLAVFRADLEIDGLPVENATARIAVSSDSGWSVPLASATYTTVTASDGRGIDASSATRAAERHALSVPADTLPTLCWLRDDSSGAAHRAWKLAVLSRGGDKQTAYVDADTGGLLALRDDVLHLDVAGTVFGNATPGTRPDHAQNPPINTGIPAILVAASGGADTHTDAVGDYVLPAQAPGTIVSSSLAVGQFGQIWNAAGPTLSGSAFVFPGQPANILLNPVTSELLTAQVNAYQHVALAHGFFRSRSAFAAIDAPVDINVNLSGLCNASFDGALNFYRASTGCYNSAYSTIVTHEYGHFIVSRLGLGQGAFGEGFADSLAMLLHETPTIGAEFYRGTAMRNPGTAGRQYPCSGSIHYCGEVLAGVWWDILQNLSASAGAAGREAARQLFVDWAQLTLGGGGASQSQSAHPLTAVEVLTADDDDNDLMNGTPHYTEICAAFAAHGIACPDLPELRFTYPDGLPDWIPPDAARAIRFRVDSARSNPLRNSGALSYSVAGGLWQTLSAVEISPHEYTVALPPLSCGLNVRFRPGARTQAGVFVNDPPSGAYATTAARQAVVSFADDFEAERGWSGAAPGDTATIGRWERAIPQATAAQPGQDHSSIGQMCWVTQAAAGSSTSSYDVDNGATTLTSPVINLSGASDAILSYWRWYSNHTASPAPQADVFDVSVSADRTNWILVERVGPAGPDASGGWRLHQFRLSDFVPPSPTVQVRFVASDFGESSTVEAAIDDVQVRAFVCDAGGCSPGCATDFDRDCFVGVSDLAMLLSHFGETVVGSMFDVYPDFRIDVSDLAMLLAAFGTRCD